MYTEKRVLYIFPFSNKCLTEFTRYCQTHCQCPLTDYEYTAYEIEERQVQLNIADISTWASSSEYLDDRASWAYNLDEDDKDDEDDDVNESMCSRPSNATIFNTTRGVVVMSAPNGSSIRGYNHACGRTRGPRPHKAGKRPVVRARPLARGARIPPLPNSYLVTPRTPG